jgi:hypothetical protein
MRPLVTVPSHAGGAPAWEVLGPARTAGSKASRQAGTKDRPAQDTCCLGEHVLCQAEDNPAAERSSPNSHSRRQRARCGQSPVCRRCLAWHPVLACAGAQSSGGLRQVECSRNPTTRGRLIEVPRLPARVGCYTGATLVGGPPPGCIMLRALEITAAATCLTCSCFLNRRVPAEF